MTIRDMPLSPKGRANHERIFKKKDRRKVYRFAVIEKCGICGAIFPQKEEETLCSACMAEHFPGAE